MGMKFDMVDYTTPNFTLISATLKGLLTYLRVAPKRQKPQS